MDRGKLKVLQDVVVSAPEYVDNVVLVISGVLTYRLENGQIRWSPSAHVPDVGVDPKLDQILDYG